MKQFLKVVIWIVVLGAVGYGVYCVLPEYPHNFLKGIVQPMVDSQANSRIQQIQNLTNSDLDDLAYKTILEKNTGTPAWVYEVGADAAEYVTFYGNGASLNLKDWTDYNGKLYTSCTVKVQFRIVGNNVEIIPYVNNVKMYIDDVKYQESNKQIKKDIFQQLLSGMKSE